MSDQDSCGLLDDLVKIWTNLFDHLSSFPSCGLGSKTVVKTWLPNFFKTIQGFADHIDNLSHSTVIVPKL